MIIIILLTFIVIAIIAVLSGIIGKRMKSNVSAITNRIIGPIAFIATGSISFWCTTQYYQSLSAGEKLFLDKDVLMNKILFITTLSAIIGWIVVILITNKIKISNKPELQDKPEK